MVDFNVLNKGLDTGPDPAPPPVKTDPFDPAPAVKLFEKFIAEIDNMDALAEVHQVVDDESCSLATTYTTQAKTLANTIEKKRKSIKEPYLKVTKTIDSFCKGLNDRLKGTQIILNNKIRPYLQKKERERREAEKQAQEKARKEQERLETEAKATGDIEPVPKVVAEAPAEVKVKTETGTADLKKDWTWEITSFKDLPDAAFEVRKDEVTKALTPWLNAQVKAGIREIPGANIFQITKIKTRARG